jgi:hypothetical protein
MGALDYEMHVKRGLKWTTRPWDFSLRDRRVSLRECMASFMALMLLVTFFLEKD